MDKLGWSLSQTSPINGFKGEYTIHDAVSLFEFDDTSVAK